MPVILLSINVEIYLNIEKKVPVNRVPKLRGSMESVTEPCSIAVRGLNDPDNALYL